MPRMRISDDGIEIAREGYDIDTAAPEDILFSSVLPKLRLALTGVITIAQYSGSLSDRFHRAIVTYSEPFPAPPLVMVAGIVSETVSEQGPFILSNISGSARWAMYSIASFADRFILYGYGRDATGSSIPRPTRTYRYFVFHNTIDDII